MRETYKSIDIRALLIKKEGINHWHYVVLKVRFTNQSQKTLTQIYKVKKENDIPDEPNFKIEFESRDIQDILDITDKIQSKQFNINGIPVQPLGTDYQNIYENDRALENDFGYTSEQERDDYPHKILVAQMGFNAVKAVEDENIKYKKIRDKFF